MENITGKNLNVTSQLQKEKKKKKKNEKFSAKSITNNFQFDSHLKIVSDKFKW